MFYVYVLVSKKDGKLYIGSTNNLKKRFEMHNDGKVESTKPRRPFVLVYYEAYADESDARKRESSLKKRGQAKYQLCARIKNSIAPNNT
ncbi:MAG: hypothetical protein UV60_C0026G0002 [Parcubacteria group bacterium GW2011_GWA2_43_11]|nr:MAG: hypothetical protein UV60_C0026G0002 [Parcubacteria group bacterium GW2011_GWA2_43_11]